MKLTFTKSKFDVPEGQYVAKFMGLEMLEPKAGEAPRMGRDGKPMAPGMAWRFEIMEGSEKGKQADRITGRMPGPKNVCGRFLAAVTGQILKDGMEVDLEPYTGKLYRINVVAKEQSEGTCVSDQGLIPWGGATNGTANGNGTPSSTPAAGPPPRRPAAPTPTAPLYYVEANPESDPLTLDEAGLRKWFADTAGANPGTTQVCKVGDAEWKPASNYFPDLIPF